jgi:hypothetical protein
MPKKSRALTLEDVAEIVALTANQADRQKVYKAVERVAAETCGWLLLTTLKYDDAKQAVVRVHSSNEQAYPIGGEKPLSKIKKSHEQMNSGEVFIAPTRAAVKETFFDYELIFSLGASAILNSPIHRGGQRLGTLNFCGEEGMYGPTEIRNAKILAGLLVPCLLQEVGS